MVVTTRKFTISEYHQMAENGILSTSDRIELIKGEIIEMSPISPRHAAYVDRLNRLFNQLFPQSVIIRVDR